MPWQKTFSLAKRSKGCHLITDEVTHHLSEGLRSTKVSRMNYDLPSLITVLLDWHTLSFHVGALATEGSEQRLMIRSLQSAYFSCFDSE